jgi:hypothetical protein
MATSKKHQPWGLHSYRLALPAGAVLPPGLPVALADDLALKTPEESPAVISVEYPRLYRRLCDLGLKFQCAYSQRAAARIIRRSTRTLRAWSTQGKIGCYRCSGLASTPSPFYTAGSIEDYLAACERGKA